MKKLADATFAQLYGRVAISHHGHLDLDDQPPSSLDPSAAAEQGRARHSTYVIYGGLDQAAPQSLVVRIVRVADGSVAWSENYPVSGANPAKIADDVDSEIQSLDDN